MGWNGPPDCSRRGMDEGTRHGGRTRVWRQSPLVAPNMLREDMLGGQELWPKRTVLRESRTKFSTEGEGKKSRKPTTIHDVAISGHLRR